MSNVAAETVAAPVVSLQTNASLSREHSLFLLHKLATDDDFRGRYEQKPAAALAELGVPLETIVNLKSACLASTKLAEKCHFAKAHQDLSNASVEDCLQMILQNPQLDFGSRD